MSAKQLVAIGCGLAVCSIAFSAVAQAPESGVDEAGASAAVESESEPNLVVTGRALLDAFDALGTEIRDLERELESSEGEEERLLIGSVERKKVQILRLVRPILDNMLAQERAGFDTRKIRAVMEPALERLHTSLERHLDAAEERIATSREEREDLEPGPLLDLEQRIAAELEWVNILLRSYTDYLTQLDLVGMDSKPARDRLLERLPLRAEDLAGRVDFTAQLISQAEERVELGEELAGQILPALEIREDSLSKSLSMTLRRMDRFELETTEYRKALITSTGEITTDILDPELAQGLLAELMTRLGEWLREVAPGFIMNAAIFVLILGAFKLASMVARLMLRRGFSSRRVRTTNLLRNMALSIVSNGVMLIGVLVALSHVGVELAPLLAGLGIAGFIVGFALQDSLGNFASGLMILAYRPYDEGDFIDAAGAFGQVSHMSLVSTTILTIDNQTLIVPNSKIWTNVIKNVTHQKTRRVDMKFRIAYEDDVDLAQSVLEKILADHPKTLSDPEPMVRLHSLDESSIEFIVRPWVVTENYWEVYWDVTREVKKRFDEAGISIPVPHRDIRVRHDQ
jgi:small conductance mechanosensitive channel